MKIFSKTDFFLLTTPFFCVIIYKLYGSLVKRLRLRPLTPATRVRFPHESPKPDTKVSGFLCAVDNLV